MSAESSGAGGQGGLDGPIFPGVGASLPMSPEPDGCTN